MSNPLTSDGDSEIITAAIVTFMFTGSLGGGTLTLKRLKHSGDPTVAGDWITIQDGLSVASYTTSPGGDTFDLGSQTPVKAVLSGATAPNLEYHLRGRNH